MRSELQEKLKASSVPECLHEGIVLYVVDGITPGGFLTAVICNNLRAAFERADDECSTSLKAIVGFFYNHTPAACWGSPERMDKWRGLKPEQK